jgi:hypothetical protein
VAAIAEVIPSWLAAATYPAAADRMTLSALLTPNPAPGSFAPWAGVKPASLDAGLQITPLSTPSMFVQVNSGSCFVPAAIAANAGWICHNNGQRQVAIAAASATLPRIDLIIAHVYDAVDDSGTLNEWQLEPVTGTPASVPAAPAAPTNAIILGQVAVAANALTVTSGNITDLRAWTVALGGILPVNGLAAVPAGYAGHYVHDRTTGRLAHNPAGGAAQPRLLPAAPVLAVANANVNEGGTTEVTVLSVTFTADGATDWEIYFKTPGVQSTQSGSPLYSVLFRTYLDSTQIDGMFTPSCTADGNNYGGLSYTAYAAAALGFRPSAGAHTAKVTFKTQTSFGVAVVASATLPIILRAKPVCL